MSYFHKSMATKFLIYLHLNVIFSALNLNQSF